MNITGYTIVTEKSITDLEKRVKDYIAKGWQPSGGVTVVKDSGLRYIQAVIQYSG